MSTPPTAYTKVICDLVDGQEARDLPSSAPPNIGRDLGPRCAARLHTGLTADCTHLDVDVEKYKTFLKTTSTIDVDNTKFEEEHQPEDDPSGLRRSPDGHHHLPPLPSPDVHRAVPASCRPRPMTRPAPRRRDRQRGREAGLVRHPCQDVLEGQKAAKKLVDLIGADVVVSVGRGISKDVEGGIKLAEELARRPGRRRGLLPRLCRRGLDLR